MLQIIHSDTNYYLVNHECAQLGAYMKNYMLYCFVQELKCFLFSVILSRRWFSVNGINEQNLPPSLAYCLLPADDWMISGFSKSLNVRQSSDRQLAPSCEASYEQRRHLPAGAVTSATRAHHTRSLGRLRHRRRLLPQLADRQHTAASSDQQSECAQWLRHAWETRAVKP